MNYVCEKCKVRQPARENDPAPKCDCGQEMVPDISSVDDKAAAKKGIYRRW